MFCECDRSQVHICKSTRLRHITKECGVKYSYESGKGRRFGGNILEIITFVESDVLMIIEKNAGVYKGISLYLPPTRFYTFCLLPLGRDWLSKYPYIKHAVA